MKETKETKTSKAPKKITIKPYSDHVLALLDRKMNLEDFRKECDRHHFFVVDAELRHIDEQLMHHYKQGTFFKD